MICCTSILLCSYHSYTAPIIYPQFLWPRYVFYTMMASQFSSMVQARPGYFGSEFLKTERNLHTTVVQKKWMFKLHHIPPNGSIKFAAWLCKQITPRRLWWWWHKQYTSEFSLWNGCPGHRNLPLWNATGAEGTDTFSIADWVCNTSYVMILCAVAQRSNMTHWMQKPTLMCICYPQWKTDTAYTPTPGLYLTPQLRRCNNEEAASSVQL